MRLGRVLVITGTQSAGAPAVDRARAIDEKGRRYVGRAILLKPWRRGERSAHARCVFVGRQS